MNKVSVLLTPNPHRLKPPKKPTKQLHQLSAHRAQSIWTPASGHVPSYDGTVMKDSKPRLEVILGHRGRK